MIDVLKKLYNRIMKRIYTFIKPDVVEISKLFNDPEWAKSYQAIVALRYIFVESYFSDTDPDETVYYQALKMAESERKKDSDGFVSLIKSISANGFNPEVPITMDLDKNVIDGTHRLAVCIYFGIKKISVTIVPRHLNPVSIDDKLKEFHLNESELSQLKMAYGRLYDKVKQQ